MRIRADFVPNFTQITVIHKRAANDGAYPETLFGDLFSSWRGFAVNFNTDNNLSGDDRRMHLEHRDHGLRITIGTVNPCRDEATFESVRLQLTLNYIASENRYRAEVDWNNPDGGRELCGPYLYDAGYEDISALRRFCAAIICDVTESRDALFGDLHPLDHNLVRDIIGGNRAGESGPA